jgi:hypothetical protein
MAPPVYRSLARPLADGHVSPLKNGRLHFACFAKFTVSFSAKGSSSSHTVTLSAGG